MWRATTMAAVIKRDSASHCRNCVVMRREATHQVLQRPGSQPIVVVQKQGELSLGLCQSSVPRGRPLRVLFQTNLGYSCILQRSQPLPRTVFGCVVDDRELPLGERLQEDASHRFAEKGQSIPR